MSRYIDEDDVRVAVTAWDMQDLYLPIHFLDLLEDVPTSDVVPIEIGTWIPIPEGEISGWNPELAGRNPVGGYICSVCGETAIRDCNDEYVLSDYCPPLRRTNGAGDSG